MIFIKSIKSKSQSSDPFCLVLSLRRPSITWRRFWSEPPPPPPPPWYTSGWWRLLQAGRPAARLHRCPPTKTAAPPAGAHLEEEEVTLNGSEPTSCPRPPLRRRLCPLSREQRPDPAPELQAGSTRSLRVQQEPSPGRNRTLRVLKF